MTSSYRSGSRFGPAALREASLNIETYSLRSHIDLEDIAIADLGDLHVVSNPNDIVERTRLVVKDLVDADKIPILLGGEHLITLGAIKALPKDVAIIDFDAHLDLRDQYMDEEYSHATFMKRATDITAPKNIFYLGTRAVSKDELNFAREQGLTIFDVNEIRRMGITQVVDRLKSGIAGFTKTYVTVDVDVFDPAYAPGVGNPEADGLAPDTVLTMASQICEKDGKAFKTIC
jgi:agmatinase